MPAKKKQSIEATVQEIRWRWRPQGGESGSLTEGGGKGFSYQNPFTDTIRSWNPIESSQ